MHCHPITTQGQHVSLILAEGSWLLRTLMPVHACSTLPLGAERCFSRLPSAQDPAAWKNIQRFIARVNPKAGQVDVNDSINMSVMKALEDNGYLAEARKRVALQAGR